MSYGKAANASFINTQSFMSLQDNQLEIVTNVQFTI